jgi:hypothetical protein
VLSMQPDGIQSQPNSGRALVTLAFAHGFRRTLRRHDSRLACLLAHRTRSSIRAAGRRVPRARPAPFIYWTAITLAPDFLLCVTARNELRFLESQSHT